MNVVGRAERRRMRGSAEVGAQNLILDSILTCINAPLRLIAILSDCNFERIAIKKRILTFKRIAFINRVANSECIRRIERTKQTLKHGQSWQL